MSKVLAIDFDGVIHDMNGPRDPGKRMGRPMPRAEEALRLLHDKGYTIIVHTLWATTPAGTKAVEGWLDFFKIPYDDVTNLKPKADAYLDNKGIRFTDWPTVIKEIGKL